MASLPPLGLAGTGPLPRWRATRASAPAWRRRPSPAGLEELVSEPSVPLRADFLGGRQGFSAPPSVNFLGGECSLSVQVIRGVRGSWVMDAKALRAAARALGSTLRGPAASAA